MAEGRLRLVATVLGVLAGVPPLVVLVCRLSGCPWLQTLGESQAFGSLAGAWVQATLVVACLAWVRRSGWGWIPLLSSGALLVGLGSLAAWALGHPAGLKTPLTAGVQSAEALALLLLSNSNGR
ncbi:MAG TPA: hypothetical protein VF768_09805, partial [Holophagaceae bacterium]